MDASSFESLLAICARALGFAVLLLYLMRTSNNRVARGYPLIAAVAATLALCTAGWTLAAIDAFTTRTLRFAISATVPFVQVLVLVMSLKWFIARHGRDPARLPANQFARDTWADTLMHAFVLFVLTIGGLFLIIQLQKASITP